MPTTYRLIAKNVLSSDTASVSFSGIPSTYTDLYVICNARSTNASVTDAIQVRFNGATDDANLSFRSLSTDGTTATSITGSNGTVGHISGGGASADTFGPAEIYVPNYAGGTQKAFFGNGGANTNGTATARIWASACLWAITSAISQMSIFPGQGPNFKAGSSFYLYGITKA